MDAGSRWVIRLGPIERRCCCDTRELAESFALRLLTETTAKIWREAAPLAPLFLIDVNGPTGSSEPQLVEESPVFQLHSYPLPDGTWMTIGSCESFGFKVACLKQKEE